MEYLKNAGTFKHFKITLRSVVLTSGVKYLYMSLTEVENKGPCLNLTGNNGWSWCIDSTYK